VKAVGWAAALLMSGLVGLVFALIGLVSIAAGGAGAGGAVTALANPSQVALDDIPAILLPLFISDAQACLGLPWPVLAGISRVESDHGRRGGATIGPDGIVAPAIIGGALDGTGGTARITDTDDGIWDHDQVWDRAVGPFQFIPSSWRVFGGDGNGDGIADPNNVFDAVPAMRRHLCPEGHLSDVPAAIYGYNHSDAYVAEVLAWAQRYTGALSVSSTAAAGHALPVPATLVDENALTQPHHDYPAWDLAVPVRTPAFAMVDGTVVTATSAGIYPADPNKCGTTVAIAGVDGAHYIYCHLSQLAVTAGQSVTAGTLLGLSGGQPGAPGAGRSTGPHIHLAVRVQATSVCPQPLLLATYRQQPFAPSAAPTTGCIDGEPLTDWPAFRVTS
jgi:hypothetical protein